MSYFRSRRKGRVYVEMPAFSALLIADLARQLIELLSDGEPTGEGGVDPLEELVVMDSPRDPPADPALLRLLPDAYPDDPEVAAEFRRFTEQSLRKAKVAAAQVVVATLTETVEGDIEPEDAETMIDFELNPDQARAWMRCLTDLRLTLAARLDVTRGRRRGGVAQPPRGRRPRLALPHLRVARLPARDPPRGGAALRRLPPFRGPGLSPYPVVSLE